jgi:hypothetical protein
MQRYALPTPNSTRQRQKGMVPEFPTAAIRCGCIDCVMRFEHIGSDPIKNKSEMLKHLT